jgi:hypothetical protein
MKTIYCKHFLSMACMLISGMVMAQSANNNAIAFKDIQRKQFSDNFTGREIKKKELEIAPSKLVLLNIVANQPTKAGKTRKEKKVSL